jgi:adenylate kinase family enzyme
MSGRRILIYGNAGSGKTTMARAMATALGVPHLDLDGITWASQEPPVRRELAATVALLEAYVAATPPAPGWVIEGCYGDVIAAATKHCTELRFLNPGVEACVAHCLQRPWEPHKFPTREAQDAMLAALVPWVREYETRTDEYGLARHREVFDAFQGTKREYTE